MKFGACRDFMDAAVLSELGYDYIETGFQGLTRWTDTEFNQKAALLEKSGLQCEAANCFLPRDLVLNNGTPNYSEMEKYIEFGMKRGAQLGLKTVVFGSGGARKYQGNGDIGELFKTILYFLSNYAAPIAEKYGIGIAIEPLCNKDSNIINRVTEGVLLASMTGADNVRGLADLYHMAVENDSCEGIRISKGWISHSHIANPNGRVYPLESSEYDYKEFIDALKYAGCERCSIEANAVNFESDAAAAIKLLREADKT